MNTRKQQGAFVDNMQVWIIGRGVPCSHNKMLGSFEFEQAQALLKEGIEVIYLSINRYFRDWRNVGIRIKKVDGIPVYSFNIPLGNHFSYKTTQKLFNAAFSALIKRIIRKYGDPDVIHIHYPAVMYYKKLDEFKMKGVKIVATEHWSKVMDKSINRYQLDNLAAYRSICDSFICVSSSLKQSVLELTDSVKGITVIPNLVISSFNADNKKHDGFHFVVSGRLVEIKQVDKVVKAFIHTFDENKEVFLTIAGGGSQYDLIEDIVKAANREKQIQLLGPVSREKMAEIMASSDALITYSKIETFCVPVIEAWMCGKPVVASSTISVMLDYYDDRLGIKVNHDRIESLELAMSQMVNKKDNYNSAWIAEFAREHFSESSVAKRLIEVYRG